MMTKLAAALGLLLIADASGVAATIRGIVTEKASGYSLSHASVTLKPIAGGGTDRTMQTSANGSYEFRNLPAGSYVIQATRVGFLTAEFGQRAWNAAGTAVKIGQDDVFTARLALARMGGISGTVRDENEVGIPAQDVAAYAATRPPRLVTHALTDDRGIYRIGGLEPGQYFVRTTGGSDGTVARIPTFSSQTQRVEEARAITVYADSDAKDGDIRPIAGRLFQLSGGASLARPGSANIGGTTITLVSDMGRTVVSGPNFRFDSLPPGHYELYAEAPEVAPGTRNFGAYADFQLDRDLNAFPLPLVASAGAGISLQGLGGGAAAFVRYRRKDLAGVGTARQIDLRTFSQLPLTPGRWEVQIVPPAGSYVADFRPVVRGVLTRPEGWHEIVVQGAGSASVSATLATGAGVIRGEVKRDGRPVPGAPVFLEAWDPATRQRLLDLRQTRSSESGGYSFGDVPPGEYRVFSGFEYTSPDPNIFDSGAVALSISQGSGKQVDLELSGVN